MHGFLAPAAKQKGFRQQLLMKNVISDSMVGTKEKACGKLKICDCYCQRM